MRKYFTWRCIGLHVLTLVLVPAFLLAGWWQYHAAVGGNDLSWAYTIEWPFFAVFGVYMWWRLIHDESTPFDRLWAARQWAAADKSGTPLHQVPGWATDKALSHEVIKASIEAARLPSLSHARPGALESHEQKLAYARVSTEPDEPRKVGLARAQSELGGVEHGLDNHGGSTIDARVLAVKVLVDEELEAYNRYLADLSWRDPPKQWGSRRHHRQVPEASAQAADPPGRGRWQRPALPSVPTAPAHPPKAATDDGTV